QVSQTQGLTAEQTAAMKSALKGAGGSQPANTTNSGANNAAVKADLAKLTELSNQPAPTANSISATTVANLQAELATAKQQVQAISNSDLTADLKTANTKLSTSKLFLTIILSKLKTQMGELTGANGGTSLTDGLAQLVTGSSSLAEKAPKLAAGINELAAGTAQLSANTDTLIDGETKVNTGLGQLNGNIPALVSGVTQLSDGSAQLRANNNTLINGQSQLASGLTQLNQQVPTLVSGVQQLAAGSQQLNANSGALNSGTSQLSSGLGQLNQQVPILTNAIGMLNLGAQQEKVGMQSLNGQVPTLVSGVNQLANGSGQLNTGLQTLQASTPALKSGVSQLATGGNQLSSGLNTLNSSTGALISGADQLTAGATKLDANSAALNNGVSQLKDGDQTLATSLQGGADQVAATPLNSKMAQMFATPTKISHDETNYVPNFGFAMAPFVISLLTLLGVTAIVMAMAHLTGLKTTRSIYQTVGLAILQGAVTTGVIILILKQIDHPIQFVTLGITLSVVTALIETVLFKYMRYWAFLLAGGILGVSVFFANDIYPAETINSISSFLGLFSPVHYTNLALRQTITGGIAINVNAVLMLLFLGIALLTFWLIFLMGSAKRQATTKHAA
ncbi:MAG TPA: hypothetical protein K8W17_00435, partial [Lapidilactobacillus dextrinicus]|nr:hypothetical protein [Lapidilactobacillus dextrinicus]